MLKPVLTNAARPAIYTVEALNERGELEPTQIPGEHPLTLYLDKRELVTLMTLGCAPEALTLGYLRNQRLLRSVEEIASIQVDWETESVAITTRSGNLWAQKDLEAKLSKRTVTTGCGQGTVFGGLMDEIDQVRLPDDARLSEEVIYSVVEKVRTHDSIYKQAGSVHACVLASNGSGGDRGDILMWVEDVGRHNALDAIAGKMWLDDMNGADKLFYTTGRLTSEMVIKCTQMGIPFLLSRSGITQMGHEIAKKVGLTTIGRCRGKHYLVFSGTQRLSKAPATQFA